MHAHASMPVSLAIIARNEADNLAACIESAADLVDEIVVVDTGSSDASMTIAASLGAQVHAFAWCDDFAAARNESLRHCTSPWVLWLDADDRLDADNRARLRDLIAGLADDHAGYVMRCISPRAEGGASVVEHVRLFRNQPDIRWHGRVHEQIRDALLRACHVLIPSDVTFRHIGYHDAATRQRKAQRNLRLLQRQLAEQPGDPFVLYNIGRTLKALGRSAEAIPVWRDALRRTPPDAPYRSRLYVLLVEALDVLGQAAPALALCREARAHFPEDAELAFHEALLLTELARPQALAAWTCWLASPPDPRMQLEDPEVRAKARHNLAALLYRQGQGEAAEAQFRTIVAEMPTSPLGWAGLARLYLLQGRPRDAEAALQHLSQLPGGEAMARSLTAGQRR